MTITATDRCPPKLEWSEILHFLRRAVPELPLSYSGQLRCAFLSRRRYGGERSGRGGGAPGDRAGRPRGEAGGLRRQESGGAPGYGDDDLAEEDEDEELQNLARYGESTEGRSRGAKGRFRGANDRSGWGC